MATTIINSEYQIGDLVWTMCENKPVQATIRDLTIDQDYGDKKKPLVDRIKWVLDRKEKISMWMSDAELPLKRSEAQLFRTKEELLQSL